MKVQAYQIADSIDIKKLKAVIPAKLTYSDSDELFYTTEANRYVYILKYGVVCFLDYYSEQADHLMEQTNHQIEFLEKRGRMDISGKKLKKFIGKTLNLKNAIAENLYIFDSPPETWEDENLSKIDWGNKENFRFTNQIP